MNAGRQIRGMERRVFPVQELRVEPGEDGRRKIAGYSAVFDVLSVPLWGFRERIKPGAFAKTIQEADIRALWNHNADYVLGRTRAGTLGLEEDDLGLRVDISPPETQWANDLMVSIDRGDVDQMSFGFEAIQERWLTEGEEQIRELVEVRLYDVSPVTFPAYPQTTVQLRGLQQALVHLETGVLTDADRRVLGELVDRVTSGLDSRPAGGGHLEGGDADEAVRARLARMRRRLELAEA